MRRAAISTAGAATGACFATSAGMVWAKAAFANITVLIVPASKMQRRAVTDVFIEDLPDAEASVRRG